MVRRNQKIKRRGKVVIPDLLANLGQFTGPPGSASRRRVVFWVRLGVLALVVFLFASGPKGTIRMWNLWQEQDKLQAENRQLGAEIVQLENVTHYLETDTTYIEKIARADSGYATPDAIIYLRPEPPDEK